MKSVAIRLIAIALWLILPALVVWPTLPALESAMAARAAHGLPVGQFPPEWMLWLGLYLASAPYLLIVIRQGDLGPVFLALKQGTLWLAARFHAAGRAAQNRNGEGPSDGV